MIVIGTNGIGTIIPGSTAHFHTSAIVHAPPAIVNALLADAILSKLKEQNPVVP
ncbi:MAG TPA: hypothetical protein PKG69_05935 [Methanoregulaceae archaeon]|nr:hypothetical protein [Methanoregulaceae archaeon]